MMINWDVSLERFTVVPQTALDGKFLEIVFKKHKSKKITPEMAIEIITEMVNYFTPTTA